MQLEAILNHLQEHSSLVYAEMRPREGDETDLDLAAEADENWEIQDVRTQTIPS
ncbi:MAG: hypothetical protein JRS35_05110 [Deltaproteobacteria bacterium]|nr:hypothetical protein [Deltaproteobacteria bacterium]